MQCSMLIGLIPLFIVNKLTLHDVREVSTVFHQICRGVSLVVRLSIMLQVCLILFVMFSSSLSVLCSLLQNARSLR